MIMSGNDKPAGMVSIIMKKLGQPEEDQDIENPEEGKDAAVEEILEAIKAEDKDKLKEALMSLIEMCFAEYEKEPHEEAPHSEE